MLLEEIPAVFNYDTLAKILDVSVSQEQRIAKQHDFPVHVLSPHVHRIYRAAFFRWMEGQSGVSAAELFPSVMALQR